MKPRLYYYHGRWCVAFWLRVTEDPIRFTCLSFLDACLAAKTLMSLRTIEVPA
jgi:hypothetical protein